MGARMSTELFVRAEEHWIDHEAYADVAPPRRAWVKAVYAVAEVLFATKDGPPPPDRLRWLCRETEDMMTRVRGNGVLVFRLSIILVSWLAPLLVLRLPTVRTVAFERRAVALDRYERSPLGMTLFVIKAMLCILYYEHPDAAADVGFNGQPLEIAAQVAVG